MYAPWWTCVYIPVQDSELAYFILECMHVFKIMCGPVQKQAYLLFPAKQGFSLGSSMLPHKGCMIFLTLFPPNFFLTCNPPFPWLSVSFFFGPRSSRCTEVFAATGAESAGFSRNGCCNSCSSQAALP